MTDTDQKIEDVAAKTVDAAKTVVENTTAAVVKTKSLWGNYQDWISNHPKTIGIVVPVVIVFLLTLAIRV